MGDKDDFALIDALMAERNASIQDDGMKKIRMGVLFVPAPVTYYFFSMFIGYWSMKFFCRRDRAWGSWFGKADPRSADGTQTAWDHGQCRNLSEGFVAGLSLDRGLGRRACWQLQFFQCRNDRGDLGAQAFGFGGLPRAE